MKKISPDDILSTAQAAAELGISVNRMNVLLNAGRLPATKLGWAWMIRRGDLELVRHRPTGRPRKRTQDVRAGESSEPKKKIVAAKKKGGRRV